MAENEFHRAVSTDAPPQGHSCEWCGEPAVVRLTAIGGLSHNESGLFCRDCGDLFARRVVQATVASVGGRHLYGRA